MLILVNKVVKFGNFIKKKKQSISLIKSTNKSSDSFLKKKQFK